ncbi:hypothetical protein ACWKWP_02575 [Agromyces soli]
MTLTAPAPPPDARSERIEALQARIRGMQATKLETRAVPTHPALAGLLPQGGLREGTAVEAIGSTTLVMALLAAPSASGRWVAVVGMPEFGIEAADRFGIALDRLVLVPHPGDRWLTVLAALAEVIPVIAVRPSGRLAPAESARIMARVRERGATLVVAGDWPGSDARIRVEAGEWHGIERGHGLLEARDVVVSAEGRGHERRRRSRMRLPDRSLGFVAIGDDAPMRPVQLERVAGRRAAAQGAAGAPAGDRRAG